LSKEALFMSKKPTLTDVPGLGPKMEKKLREAGVKTVAKLSKSAPEKLAGKVDGLSEAGAAKLIDAAQKMVSPPAEKPKKAPKKPEAKPKKAAKKKATIAVARKLAIVMHRLWITAEVYEPVGYEEQLAALAA